MVNDDAGCCFYEKIQVSVATTMSTMTARQDVYVHDWVYWRRRTEMEDDYQQNIRHMVRCVGRRLERPRKMLFSLIRILLKVFSHWPVNVVVRLRCCSRFSVSSRMSTSFFSFSVVDISRFLPFSRYLMFIQRLTWIHGNRRQDSAHAHTMATNDISTHTKDKSYIDTFMASNFCNFFFWTSEQMKSNYTLIAANNFSYRKYSSFDLSHECLVAQLYPKIKYSWMLLLLFRLLFVFYADSVSIAAKCQVVPVHCVAMILLVIGAQLTAGELSSHSISTFIFHAAKHWQTIVNEQRA